MKDKELIEWLEDNSSGIYQAYDAAQRIKELRMAITAAMGEIGMNEDDDSIRAYDILKKYLNQSC